MKKILLLSAWLLFVSSGHPFYLGVTDLNYKPKEQTIQGTVKLFTNDLETALGKINKKKVDLFHVTDTATTHTLLSLYLKTHLSMELNSKARSFDFIGFEKEEEATLLYIEFKNCEYPERMQLKNRLLYDFLPAQTNIVRISIHDSFQSLKAINPESDFLFDFKK